MIPIVKAIAAGILAGVALFLAPFFLLRILFVVLIIGFIVRLFGGRRRHWHRGYGFWHNPEYVRRWRSMTDEERRAFMAKMEKELFATREA